MTYCDSQDFSIKTEKAEVLRDIDQFLATCSILKKSCKGILFLEKVSKESFIKMNKLTEDKIDLIGSFVKHLYVYRDILNMKILHDFFLVDKEAY